MKIVIDMNLSPEWEDVLCSAGWMATHWSRVGAVNASDRKILSWVKVNGYVLLTHDLDFGAILAASGANAPSVIQVRAQDLTPSHLAPLVLRVLSQFREVLARGALISVDDTSARTRMLPLTMRPETAAD
jgi:predicted nuclease of predicted toxin-antitoxin system